MVSAASRRRVRALSAGRLKRRSGARSRRRGTRRFTFAGVPGAGTADAAYVGGDRPCRLPGADHLKIGAPGADHQAVRVTVALVLSVLSIAGAVLYASESQRGVADENYHEAIVARQLATDMLSRENALHEFLATGEARTLASIYTLDRGQDAALDEAR